MTSKILWLSPPNFTGGLRSLLNHHINASPVSITDIYFSSITAGMIKQKSKTVIDFDRSKSSSFFSSLNQLLAHVQPKAIVVNDKAALGFITNKYTSLALCRGGVYMYKFNDIEIPCIVVDDTFKLKSTTTGSWILEHDLAKINRFSNGCPKPEPKFNYTVCSTTTLLHSFEFDVLSSFNEPPLAISIDIETSGAGKYAVISSIGYTVWFASGKLHTYIIPLMDGSKPNGCFWENQKDEINAWQVIRDINSSSIPKIFQNGTYDNTYLLRYRVPIVGWFLDSLNLFHSIWPEARKKLDFISSICIDHYRYWKDEGKEDEKDDVKNGAVPSTPAGMLNYWRYNALDCHNTMLCVFHLLKFISLPQMSWAMINYVREIRTCTGPAFAMSMRGVHVNDEIKQHLCKTSNNKAAAELYRLQTAVGNPDFNPGSPKQVADLIYNTLHATPLPRKGTSTNEQILEIIRSQSPILDIVIKQIWAAKKPANNASKYGDKLWLWNNRWYYKMNGTGTETGRYASKAHDLWFGTQIQNVPYSIRPMVEADPGYVLWRIDYSQSDAYFTAFTSGDQNYIDTMLSPDDTHCINASRFFKKPYDKIYAGYLADEDWVTNSTKGVRQLTKRICYGANYLMAGYTLLVTMGYESVVAAAEQMGFTNAHTWQIKQLVSFCQAMLNEYFKIFPDINEFLKAARVEAFQNNNLATCAFGMTRWFLGDLINDDATQREFAAFFGQGGTAGNINKAIDRIYYGANDGGPADSSDCYMLFQTHDDITGQCRSHKLELINEINRRMSNPCTIHGRTFTVPTEIQVGLGWGKRMMKYHSGITIDEIKAHDEKWKRKFFS